jgi:hypothetical protein
VLVPAQELISGCAGQVAAGRGGPACILDRFPAARRFASHSADRGVPSDAVGGPQQSFHCKAQLPFALEQ